MALNFPYDTLALRSIRREDSDQLLSWRNHPSVRQVMYTDHIITHEEHVQWLDKVLSDASRPCFIFEVSGVPYGFIGFSGLSAENGRAAWTFHMNPEKLSQGLGTAMGYLAMEQAFDVLGVRKLEGEVISNNYKSLKFHRRLGFREEGVRQAHILKDGNCLDVHEFSVLSEEWQKIRTHLFDELFAHQKILKTPKTKLRLLFTGGGGSASQSLQEQWGGRYDIWFADANPHGFPPLIPEDRRLVIPYARDPEFTEKIFRLSEEHKIDLIVPGVDEELLVLAQKQGQPGWPPILVPDADFVSLMLDKLASAQAISAAKLDAPQTLPLEQAAALSFPIIAKPRSGRGSRGVMRLERLEQVAAYLSLQNGRAEDYIAQELVEGDEYTVFVAADGGAEPRAIIPVRAFEKRGVTVRAETDAQHAVIAYACAFQAHFRASGCYNIQCMLTPNGSVFPFEVNPRISTTFVLAIATGFDPIPMAIGQDAGPMFVPQQRLSLQRSWHTYITHGHTELTS